MPEFQAGPMADLTPEEADMVSTILAGRRADLKGNTIRANTLRTLVVEARSDWSLPPIGVLLDNAVIEGTLDLEGCTITKPLVFHRCKFRPLETARGSLRLRDARVKRLALHECSLMGTVFADRCHVESALFLSACALDGGLRLRGATIGEALAMDKVRANNPGDVAVLADGLHLGGPWILRGAEIIGELRLAGARVGGSLLWEEAKVSNGSIAIAADGAVCDGAWVLRRANVTGPVRLRGMKVRAIDAQLITITAGSEAFNARGAEIASDLVLDGATVKGQILLGRAQIAGEFSANGARVTAPAQSWAMACPGIKVNQGIALANAKLQGGLMLAGARIGQAISASNIEIASEGRAIEADVIQLRGNWIMRGAQISGNVRFAGAQIDGQIGFTECHIEGGGDLAIRADGANIRGGWFMGRARIKGLVRLPSACIGNEMRLRGTTIEVQNGPALFANGARIARELSLDGGFTTKGGVVFDRAEIDGTLDFSESLIQSALLGRGSGPSGKVHDEIMAGRYDTTAISLVDARLDRLVMPDTAEHRPQGIVDLSRARVGSYEDAAIAWPPALRDRRARGRDANGRDVDHLVVDGFTYDHLEVPSGIPADQLARRPGRYSAALMRTRWLEAQSSDDLELHFKPQAWLQLSRRLSAQGYSDDARRVAIERRRRQRQSASTGKSARLQSWLLDVFALYGFNPWRTVLWSIGFVLVFGGLWWWAALGCGRDDCKDEQVYVMSLKGNYGQDDAKSAERYPAFSPLLYSVDVFLPFVDFGFKEHWKPNTNYLPFADIHWPALGRNPAVELSFTTGGVLYAAYVLEMLLGLILTSVAVTGFAGLLKGDDDPR